MQKYYSSCDWWADSTHTSDELLQSSLSSPSPAVKFTQAVSNCIQTKPGLVETTDVTFESHLRFMFTVQKANSLQRKLVKWYKKTPPNCRTIDLLPNDIYHPPLPCFSSVRWGCEGLMGQWADQMFRISSHFKQPREGTPTREDKEWGL